MFKEILNSYYEGCFEEKIEEVLKRPNVNRDSLSRAISALCGVNVDYSKNFISDLKEAIAKYTPNLRVITKIHDCSMDCLTDKGETSCQRACPFGAIFFNKDTKHVEINEDNCMDCGMCVGSCPSGNLMDRVEFIPLLNLLKENKNVIAVVAPAIIGQFGENVTINQLRAAIKKIGFTDMMEVAFFADILTIKEAIEFNEHVNTADDFMISSCCCPVWVGMSKKLYGDLITHVSPSVSPMIASGRGIKRINPECKVVFIGPCIAKKAEAKNLDLLNDIDFVLTFKELKDIFDTLNIHPEEMEEDTSFEYASREGRLYGHTGGVSTAVKEAVKELFPDKYHLITAAQANGVKDCKEMLDNIIKGNITGRFIEGMGCVGGCVGGPKVIIPMEEGTKRLVDFAEDSSIKISIDSPPMKLFLEKLGIDTSDPIESKDKFDLFKRDF